MEQELAKQQDKAKKEALAIQQKEASKNADILLEHKKRLAEEQQEEEISFARKFYKSKGSINAIAKFMKDIPKAAKGAFFPEPTLAMVAEKGPEVVAPIPMLQNIISKGSRDRGVERGADVNVNVSATFNIQTLDPMTMRDVVRDQIEPQLLETIKSGVRKTPWKQVMGVT